MDTAPFTLEVWIRLQTADAVYRHLFTKDNGASIGREGYDVVIQQDQIFFQRYVGGKQLLAGVGNSSLLNTWAHVVSTYDGQLLRLYVDGKELARKADARPQLSKSTSFVIGMNNGTDGPVLADVDEVAIYDKALTPERITAHYLRGAGP